MSVRFGRCRTPLTCSVAESRVVLRLWENEPFFCPECARPLAEAPPWDNSTGYRSLMLAAGLTLMVASAGSAAWLLLQPGAAPRQATVLAPVAPARVAALPRPRTVTELRPPHTIPVAPLPMVAAPQFPPQALAIVAPRRHAPNVTVLQPKLLQSSLGQAKPAAPKSAQPPAAASLQGVTTPQPVHAPAPAALAQPQAVVQATAQPAAPIVAQPSNTAPPGPHGPRAIVLPAGSKLSFGPLEGVNLPALPPRMIFASPAATRKPGSIDVDCKIGLDGIPTDCRKVADHGGGEVSDTILAWLGSGAIRYSPAIKDGRKVVARRVLTVNFGGSKEP